MKLLLFSDLHADVSAAKSLVECSKTADVVIGAGDFGNMRRQVDLCIQVLQSISCPAILVPGNNESTDELRAACKNWKSAVVLHGSGVTVNGIQFYGLGGGIPITPFGDWSFDFDETEAEKLLREMPNNAVLVSHSPPKGAVDLSSRGQSIGSTAVRDAIVSKQPVLTVCGHVHASAGKLGRIGTLPVVNAGPKGVEWALSQ